MRDAVGNALPRKHRAGAVVIHGDQLLVNWRQKLGKQFFVLPGGETEPGETTEQAVVRELAEETSIVATVDCLLYELFYADIPDRHHSYFLCRYVSGEPRLRADAEEQVDNARGENLYRPMWLPIDQLATTKLYPLEIRTCLSEDLRTSFVHEPRRITVNWADRQQ